MDGRIDIEVTDFKFWHTQNAPQTPDFTKIGFFITLTDSETDLSNDVNEVGAVASVKGLGWQELTSC